MRQGGSTRRTGPERPPRPRAARGTVTRRGGAAPLLAAALLCTVASSAGCQGPGAGSPSASRPAASSPVPLATSPEEICVQLVTYWSREALAGRDYGDYQKMGMSNGQYNILLEAVAAARPVQQRQGTPAAQKVIDRQVREGCADRYHGGGPSERPWR